MEPTWKMREKGVSSIPNTNKVHVPLIIRPLKLPRHTYKQVSLVLYAKEAYNLVWCYWWKKKGRLAIMKRSFE